MKGKLDVKRKRVTIRDVAKSAGVSHQTVSRVINGRDDVSPETRDLVKKTIKSLGYLPNASARSLAAGRTNTLACIAPNLVDFTFAALIEGAELMARQHGYFLMAASAPDAKDFRKVLNQLYESSRIDGVLVINPFIDERTAYLPKDFPTVFIGDVSKNEEIGWVALDDVKAGYMAAKHLLELGHRDILCITGLQNEACTKDRNQGIFQAFAEYGVPLDSEKIINGDWAATSAYQAVESALKNNIKFTAVLAENDRMAIGAMRAFRDAGFSVPEQYSVIGIDDMPLASYFDPPLTTIQQNVTEIGKEAAEMLIQKIAQPELKGQSSRFSVQLIQRKSTAPIAGKGGD
jgi:DNA-binding LacI/PurR family transcriptional regulator